MKRQRDGETSKDHPTSKKPRLNSLTLSARLRTIASFVTPSSTVADVACHHAHVAVYLAQHSIALRVIGTEITEGSWRVAQETVNTYQVEDKVQIKLGDGQFNILFSLELTNETGLIPINEGEVDTIIIAGVGTTLAVNILQQRPAVVAKAKRLILQPQFECEEMRRYLHTINFKIIEEVMLEENNQYYTIIIAEPGEQTYDDEGYKYGQLLLLRSDPIMVRWWEVKLEKLIKNIMSIEHRQLNTASNNANAKLVELNKEVETYRQLINMYKRV